MKFTACLLKLLRDFPLSIFESVYSWKSWILFVICVPTKIPLIFLTCFWDCFRKLSHSLLVVDSSKYRRYYWVITFSIWLFYQLSFFVIWLSVFSRVVCRNKRRLHKQWLTIVFFLRCFPLEVNILLRVLIYFVGFFLKSSREVGQTVLLFGDFWIQNVSHARGIVLGDASRGTWSFDESSCVVFVFRDNEIEGTFVKVFFHQWLSLLVSVGLFSTMCHYHENYGFSDPKLCDWTKLKHML